jgi:prepilin-type N-terminal cleavage/methylation domain-containing protein
MGHGFVVRARAAVGKRLVCQRGYSVTELLTVMAILSFVLAGLSNLFVGASKSEVDMNKRFQAQQHALLGLDKIRRELHCASAVSPTTGTVQSITITLSSSCTTGTGTVTWCTIASGSTWSLWRTPGSTCTSTGGVKWADYLTAANAFTPTRPTASLPYVHVSFPINVQGPTATTATYKIADDIVLRNAAR